MRDVAVELKELRLHGMAGAWNELTTQEGQETDAGVQTSRWLIEHLLQVEHTQRAIGKVRHQMKAAKFPLHRDLAGFEPDPVWWTPRSTKSVIHGRPVRSLATNRNRPAVGNAVPLIATTPG